MSIEYNFASDWGVEPHIVLQLKSLDMLTDMILIGDNPVVNFQKRYNDKHTFNMVI